MLNKNIIDEDIYKKYYDLEIFKEANKIFEENLNKCSIQEKNKNFTDFNISTITSIIKFADNINIKVLYEQIKIDDDIIYLEYNNKIKGKREKKIKKKNKVEKKLQKKGKCFSNQLSIGFNCKEHFHKKPISLKVFSKGSLTLTGVKSEKEIDDVINKFLNIINNIKKEYYYEDKKIILLPYNNIYSFNNIKKKIETINGSFKCNFNINLNNLKKIINNKYKDGEIYLKNNRSALIELDLLFYNNYDERKNKNKTPKISIYGTGSIVINSINEEILYKSYEFIKLFIIENYEELLDIDYNFNL